MEFKTARTVSVQSDPMKPTYNSTILFIRLLSLIILAGLCGSPGVLADVQNATTADTSANATSKVDDQAIMMEAMTVTTATRSEKAIDHIPGSVDLITQNDISNMLIVSDDPTKILELSIPGYSPSRESVDVNGENIRGRLPLYLLDGIPMSTPLREGDREGYYVDQSDIARIEVVNGPSATEGLGASGGIVNIITKSPRTQGNETEVDASVNSQFDSDSTGWRTDVTFAHKESGYDLFVGAAVVDRGMEYDGHGILLGMDLNGASMDSSSHDLFLKLGKNFGMNNSQRLQFSINRYDLTGNGNFRFVSPTGSLGVYGFATTATSVRGAPPGVPPSNVMQEENLEWTDADLAGGTLTAQIYLDRETMSFGAQNVASFQDPLIAPLGTLYDQSVVETTKYGARTIWVRPNLFLKGLELSVGFDFLSDKSLQGLLVTNRVFVPPIHLTDEDPFAQLEYEAGPITVRGGVRYDDAQIGANSFTGRYAVNRVFVQGGRLFYHQLIPNIGAIYRLPLGFSLNASYSEGYSIPDVGVVLRNINIPNQTVASLGQQVTPIIATNYEGALTWRGSKGSLSVDCYHSYSQYGSSLVLNSATGVYDLSRLPVEITGWELTGKLNPIQSVELNGIFSHVDGKTSAVAGGPLILDRSFLNEGPTKILGSIDWAYSKAGTINLEAVDYLSRNINVGEVGFEEHFPGYILVNVRTKYQTKWGTIGLGIENLFNKFYVQYVSHDVAEINLGEFLAGRGREATFSDTIRF